MTQKNQERLEEGKKIVYNLTEEKVLTIFNTGCDKKNYRMITQLPANDKELAEKINLTHGPTNRRINQIIEAGIAKREDDEVKLTELGQKFIDVVEMIQEDVIEYLVELTKEDGQ